MLRFPCKKYRIVLSGRYARAWIFGILASPLDNFWGHRVCSPKSLLLNMSELHGIAGANGTCRKYLFPRPKRFV
jgi:hypothetical protein